MLMFYCVDFYDVDFYDVGVLLVGLNCDVKDCYWCLIFCVG